MEFSNKIIGKSLKKKWLLRFRVIKPSQGYWRTNHAAFLIIVLVCYHWIRCCLTWRVHNFSESSFWIILLVLVLTVTLLFGWPKVKECALSLTCVTHVSFTLIFFYTYKLHEAAGIGRRMQFWREQAAGYIDQNCLVKVLLT